MSSTPGRRRRRGGAAADRGPAAPEDPAQDDRAADPDADPASVARAIALRQLTMAPRSRAQLREAMDRKNVPADVAEAVLDRLEEVRLVDDAAFAENYVRYRQRERGLARRALAHELRRKGVDDDTARAALEELDPDDEVEAARSLVERKLPSMQRLDPAVRFRRLVGMLARKGYPSSTAVSVVKQALADVADAAGDGDAADYHAGGGLPG
jgi:regulatory protein